MKSINSKDKGKRGERAWVARLALFGFKSKRTGFHQSQQGHDAPDVTCDDLKQLHWEVKNTQLAKVRDWQAQAKGDAKSWQIPVVAWKANHRPWTVILDGDDFLRIMQCCDLQQLEELKQMKVTNTDQ